SGLPGRQILAGNGGAGRKRPQILLQHQVAPGDQEDLSPGSLPERNGPPVFRAETLFDGGEQQGVFQLAAALEQEELPVVAEGPQEAAIAEEKIVFAGVLPDQASQGFLEYLQESGGGGPGGGLGEPVPQKFKGAGRIAVGLQQWGLAAPIGFNGPGLAVVSEEPGLPPKVQGKGVGVALVHLAAAPVADMGQDDRFGYHPGQALEGVVRSPIPEDRFCGLLHHRLAAAEETDPPAVNVAAAPGGKQGQGTGGAMATGGAQGEKVAH